MAVDLFDFDFWVHCFAEFVLERGFSNIKVMSGMNIQLNDNILSRVLGSIRDKTNRK
jgi:hypothetical protein